MLVMLMTQRAGIIMGQKKPVANSGLTNRGAKNKDPRKIAVHVVKL